MASTLRRAAEGLFELGGGGGGTVGLGDIELDDCRGVSFWNTARRHFTGWPGFARPRAKLAMLSLASPRRGRPMWPMTAGTSWLRMMTRVPAESRC